MMKRVFACPLLIILSCTLAHGEARSPEGRLHSQSHVNQVLIELSNPQGVQPGIFLQLVWPSAPRYPDGTAAVVSVPGADSTSSISRYEEIVARNDYWKRGLVWCGFTFPGGGVEQIHAGGEYDHRGMSSLEAVAEVVLFLKGEISAVDGRRIGDVIPYPILQVGLMGLSNGGNTSVCAMALTEAGEYVDWYVGWENPAGPQFATVDIGSRIKTNPFYRPGCCQLTSEGVVCEVDYSTLSWDPDAAISGGVPSEGIPGADPERPGVLFHDEDGDGEYDEAEYALGSYFGEFGGVLKRVLSARAAREAASRGLIDPWPDYLATVEETEEYWSIRDMSRVFNQAVAANRDIAAIVIGTEQDHVQGTPDHPHIVLHYQGWREAGAPWVRLNPDRAYVRLFSNNADIAPDCPANSDVTFDNITQYLAPEVISDGVLEVAAALELADRTWSGSWAADLDLPLGDAGMDGRLELPHTVEMLDDGNVLIADGGGGDRVGRVEIVSVGGVVKYNLPVQAVFLHSATFSPDGARILVTDTGGNRVLELERATGRVVWDSAEVGLELRYPNDADYWDANTFLITDRDNGRVILVSRDGTLLRQVTGLSGPHNADATPDGGIVVADSNADRVLVLDPAWQIRAVVEAGFDWPRDADLVYDGLILVTDSRNNRVVLVTENGEILQELSGFNAPYEADLLPDGSLLVSDSGNRRVLRVDWDGEIRWSIPPADDKYLVERYDGWITDSEGHSIAVGYLKPLGNGPFPAVIYSPNIAPGKPKLMREELKALAASGFVVASYNPEGRGQPGVDMSEGEETCQGPNQQEDLKSVAYWVADLPFVDSSNIGVFSFSSGALLVGSALGRWPDIPVAYWVDGEGPHNGSIIFGDPCGHPNTQVDDSPENLAFWEERSPVNFIGMWPGYYLRVQAEVDHIQGNYVEHALLMNNAACQGETVWVRINSKAWGNEPNTVYPVDDPSGWPTFIPGALRDQPLGELGTLLEAVKEMSRLVASRNP